MWADVWVGVGGRAVRTGHARVVTTTCARTSDIAVRPIHVEVADLGVCAIRKDATARVGDDDLETVGQVAVVLPVTDVDVIDVDGVCRALPLDFAGGGHVCVLPVTRNLVVFRRREACGRPVQHVCSKGDLAFRVHKKLVVRGAIQIERPRIVQADVKRLGRCIDVPTRTAHTGSIDVPRDLIGTQPANSWRGHHREVRVVGFNPALAVF